MGQQNYAEIKEKTSQIWSQVKNFSTTFQNPKPDTNPIYQKLESILAVHPETPDQTQIFLGENLKFLTLACNSPSNRVMITSFFINHASKQGTSYLVPSQIFKNIKI